jgi:hypothetical protein
MNPSNREYTTAMAADSVGVKMPARIPPITITIISNDGTALSRISKACPKETLSMDLSHRHAS